MGIGHVVTKFSSTVQRISLTKKFKLTKVISGILIRLKDYEDMLFYFKSVLHFIFHKALGARIQKFRESGAKLSVHSLGFR